MQVAMMRDKHKEKIPFRLTRMLIRAMEVTGIEGNFRCTAENVMRVLRYESCYIRHRPVRSRL